MSGVDLSDYVDVATRIARFYAEHPDGRIQATPPAPVTIGDRVFLACTATVYRTPDDPTPCVGSAWEPWPGRTPYTRDSEAMNAETSAVGRALALAGIEVRRSIATADEVRARRRSEPSADEPAVDWPALGWASQAEHDAERNRVREQLGALDDHVRHELRDLWADRGFAWPLSRDRLAEWDDLTAAHLDDFLGGEQ